MRLLRKCPIPVWLVQEKSMAAEPEKCSVCLLLLSPLLQPRHFPSQILHLLVRGSLHLARLLLSLLRSLQLRLSRGLTSLLLTRVELVLQPCGLSLKLQALLLKPVSLVTDLSELVVGVVLEGLELEVEVMDLLHVLGLEI